jgi:hypothetical protein
LSSPIQTKQKLQKSKEYSVSYDNLKKLATPRHPKISARMQNNNPNNKGQVSDRTIARNKKIRKKFLTREYELVSCCFLFLMF